MRTFQDLFTYNDWANRRVYAFCRGLDPALLTEAAPGTNGTLAETLKHSIGVEDAYLMMLRGQSIGSGSDDARDRYFAQDLSWFLDRGDQIGSEYVALLAGLDRAALDQPLNVPWFSFPVTGYDGLMQVLAHSAQHRAQIFSVLGSRGMEVPGLDYVRMVGERRQAGTR
ncbi:MAG TPA: DinB family protein [Chloroflexota bacterium]|nr:DinB family protein [Chloroflexota bacterium]